MKPISNTKKGVAGTAVAAILAAIFTLEGGYVNDPKDPGGETNHGITTSVARDAGYLGSMRDMSQETATFIYITNYIDKPGYGEVVSLSPAVGHKLVDAGVNTGTGRSSRWFQIALNSLNRGGRDYQNVSVDGKIGAGSIAAYKNLQRVRGKVKACEMVIKLVDAQQANHYMSLTNLSVYTPGWVDHRVGNVPLSKCAE
ncbi:MAG: glycosyl hydrolase 108 family protein [Sphaerochaetaceae bacterium]